MDRTNRSESELFRRFTSPDPEYFPAVYWFWHHIPSRYEIETQLEQIQGSGFKTFLIQARLALPIEDYLSEEYLNAYLYAMMYAEHLGLTAGLYDDYNWLSGHAGGRTVSGNNQLRERHLFWSSTLAVGGDLLCAVSGIRSLMVEGLGTIGMNWCYEMGLIQWDDWKIFKVLAYPDVLNLEPEMVADISEHCRFEEISPVGCVVRVELPESIPARWKVTVFVAGRCITSRAMNYLLPEATKKFLEVAYKPFAERMKDFLGDPLAFAFFDHPHAGFYSWDQHEGNVLNSLMFDEDLATVFTKERGYPVEWALLSLIHPLGDFTSKFRCDFFDTYGRIAREAFFGQLTDWTRAHNMGLAGHELLSYIGQWGFLGGFEKVDHRTNFGADYFAVDRYRTITTVDAFNSFPQISAKMGDSLAKANGRRGCIIEQYYVSEVEGNPWAVGQWNLTLDAYRSQAIRHHILGARQFLYHGFYLSEGEDGDFSLFENPRFDFPPGINLEPWVALHADFALEMARLSAFIHSGDAPTNLGVLYPLRTYWAEGVQHSFVQESAFWNRWLVEHGINFDIVNEEQILSARIIDGGLETNYRKYEALLLPGVSTLQSNQTYEKILAFINKNGLLIASGQLPTATQELGFDSELENRFRDIFTRYRNAVYFADKKDLTDVQDRLYGYLKSDKSKSFRVNFLRDPARHVWSWHGVNPSGTLVVLFNDSMENEELAFSVPNPATPERLDPLWGTRVSWAWFNRDVTHTTVHLLLNPKELTCFLLKPIDSKLRPRLVTSSMPASHASNQDGDLNLIFETDQDGQDLIASVYSPVEPSIEGETSFQGNNVWHIKVRAPSLPKPIVLEEGWTFYIGKNASKKEIDINRGWEMQGYADYSGMGTYECDLTLNEEYLACDLDLAFQQIETAAEIYINGELIGKRGWPPYQFSIPKSKISSGGNHLQVNVYNTGGNRYYQNTPYAGSSPTPSGIIGAPWIKPVHRIIITSQDSGGK